MTGTAEPMNGQDELVRAPGQGAERRFKAEANTVLRLQPSLNSRT